jgi:hypothetical protein
MELGSFKVLLLFGLVLGLAGWELYRVSRELRDDDRAGRSRGDP